MSVSVPEVRPLFGNRITCCLILAGLCHWISLQPVLGGAVADKVPFSTDAKTIATTIEAIPFPEDETLEYLTQATHFQFDKDGKLTKRIYRMYRVATDEAAQDHALVQAEWSPWHEQPPTMKARVIWPDGKEFILDSKTISESANHQTNRQILSDRRMLHAPLPAMKAGVVVEEEIEWKEHQNFFAAGRVEQTWMSKFSPIRKAKVSIEAPVGFRFQHAVRGLEIKATESTEEGLHRVVYEVSDPPLVRNRDPYDDLSKVFIPEVVICTGQSWSDIAKAYLQLSEPRIDPASVQSLAKETLSGEESRLDAAEKLLAEIRKRVRYTGLEFGESSLVPYSPADVLMRGYGDCKDQSTLLVSLLRSAGYEARIALLYAGGRTDALRDFPGLNAFNHAIVFLPGNDSGEQPVWIDPTSPYSTPGLLPFGDQNRVALVIDERTTELITTPKTSSRDTVGSILSIVQMMPASSNVNEVRSSSGVAAADLREHYAKISKSEAEKYWRDAGKEEYGEDRFAGLTLSDSNRVNEPFQISINFTGVQWGNVTHSEAVIGLDLSELFDKIPWFLRTEESEELKPDQLINHNGPRRSPLHWPEPHTRELVFRVTPPQGYVVRELPDDHTEQFGMVIYSERYQQDGETIIATYRFETGDEPVSPADVSRMRMMISQLLEQSESSNVNVVLQWDHIAGQLMAQGELREAFAKYRELIAAHPQETIHDRGYVDALLQHGFGHEARRVAAQVVHRLPESASAHYVLGLAFTRDELGRETHPGFERDKAIQAYHKAVELDPECYEGWWDLAVMLEHDDYGYRYQAGPNLEEAIRIYRSLLDQDKAFDFHEDAIESLAYCLFYHREFSQVLQLAKKHPTVPPELQVAATAFEKGFPSARRLAESLKPPMSERLQLLLQAGTLLDRGRHYKLAISSLRAGMSGLTDTTELTRLINILQQLTPFEDLAAAADQPEHPMQQLFSILLTNGVAEQKMQEYTVNSQFATSREIVLAAEVLQSTRLTPMQNGTPWMRTRDAISRLTYERTGNPEVGYCFTLANVASTPLHVYVIRVNESTSPSYRVLLSGNSNSELGCHALKLLDEGKIDAARQWLEWGKQGLGTGSLFSPVSGSPFARIWGNIDKNSPQELRVAAAVLAATSGKKELNPILEEAVEKEQGSLMKRQFQRALCAAYLMQDDAVKLFPVIMPLYEQSPDVYEVAYQMIWAKWKAGDPDAALALLKQKLDKNPKVFAPLQELLMAISKETQGYKLCYDSLQQICEAGPENPIDLNSVAWTSLKLDPIPETGLELARRSCELSRWTRSGPLHTYATLLAEEGNLEEAQSILASTVNARPYIRVTIADLYTIGRMAEHCGLTEAAREAYQQVLDGKDPDIRILAHRRFAGLGDRE